MDPAQSRPAATLSGAAGGPRVSGLRPLTQSFAPGPLVVAAAPSSDSADAHVLSTPVLQQACVPDTEIEKSVEELQIELQLARKRRKSLHASLPAQPAAVAAAIAIQIPALQNKEKELSRSNQSVQPSLSVAPHGLELELDSPGSNGPVKKAGPKRSRVKTAKAKQAADDKQAAPPKKRSKKAAGKSSAQQQDVPVPQLIPMSDDDLDAATVPAAETAVTTAAATAAATDAAPKASRWTEVEQKDLARGYGDVMLDKHDSGIFWKSKSKLEKMEHVVQHIKDDINPVFNRDYDACKTKMDNMRGKHTCLNQKMLSQSLPLPIHQTCLSSM